MSGSKIILWLIALYFAAQAAGAMGQAYPGFTGSAYSVEEYAQRLEEGRQAGLDEEGELKIFAASPYSLRDFKRRKMEAMKAQSFDKDEKLFLMGSEYTRKEFETRLMQTAEIWHMADKKLRLCYAYSHHGDAEYVKRHEELQRYKDLDVEMYIGYLVSEYTIDEYRERMEMAFRARKFSYDFF